MTKLGEALIQSMMEIRDHQAGKATKAVVSVPAAYDTKAMRQKLAMTQAEFAKAFGFSTDAVRDWEQGRKAPDRSTQAYLTVIRAQAASVLKTLKASPPVFVKAAARQKVAAAVVKAPRRQQKVS